MWNHNINKVSDQDNLLTKLVASRFKSLQEKNHNVFTNISRYKIFKEVAVLHQHEFGAPADWADNENAQLLYINCIDSFEKFIKIALVAFLIRTLMVVIFQNSFKYGCILNNLIKLAISLSNHTLLSVTI